MWIFAACRTITLQLTERMAYQQDARRSRLPAVSLHSDGLQTDYSITQYKSYHQIFIVKQPILLISRPINQHQTLLSIQCICVITTVQTIQQYISLIQLNHTTLSEFNFISHIYTFVLKHTKPIPYKTVITMNYPTPILSSHKNPLVTTAVVPKRRRHIFPPASASYNNSPAHVISLMMGQRGPKHVGVYVY